MALPWTTTTVESLPFLPWWDADATVSGMTTEIEAARQELASSPAMAMFCKRNLLAFVFMANKLEQTLPDGYEDLTTYKLLEQQLEGEQLASSRQVLAWPAEGGGNSEQTRQQLLQFCAATQYLCWPLRVPLTVSDIKTAHMLMMSDAMDNELLLAAGEFRQTAAHSGTGYIYPEFACIPEELKRIVSCFNAALSSKQVANVSLAADLLYQFVTLHPFQNGNGRMCRLLAAYAARVAGEPFLINLSNGHSKTRQHYHQVLRHADKHGGSTLRLQSYILDTLHGQWQNALAYCNAGQQCSMT